MQMTDRVTYTCYEPTQAKRLVDSMWMLLKSHLMADRRMLLEMRPEKRSDAQNRLLWARLGEIAKQVVWHGQKLDSTDWKHILTASLKKQRVAPGIDGGFVILGQKTSKMTKVEMTELLELIAAFGAQQGVRFIDDIPYEQYDH